jgi:hypothetical protein
MKANRVDSRLPVDYAILPHMVPLRVPGFSSFDADDNRTLAISPDCTATCYNDFVDRIIAARSRAFLPVARMSDGEYMFALGPQAPDVRLPRLAHLRSRGRQIVSHFARRGTFRAGMRGRYHSGEYTAREWRGLRDGFGTDVHALSQVGIIAWHLTYSSQPFQERYFPALSSWWQQLSIRVTPQNYVPFYFVYAALTGWRRRELLSGRILVVNSATGAKRQRIETSLEREGATQVHWLSISERRSLIDRIDVSSYVGHVDLALVGAGIGKANIMRQMCPLEVPCLDAGFVFEVWDDPARAVERPYCLPDPPASPAERVETQSARGGTASQGRTDACSRSLVLP